MSGKSDVLVLDRVLTQADFDAFAELSGDDNPIHLDPAFSANTRFGRTVSHGMLLCTVLRGLLDQLAARTTWPGTSPWAATSRPTAKCRNRW